MCHRHVWPHQLGDGNQFDGFWFRLAIFGRRDGTGEWRRISRAGESRAGRRRSTHSCRNRSDPDWNWIIADRVRENRKGMILEKWKKEIRPQLAESLRSRLKRNSSWWGKREPEKDDISEFVSFWKVRLMGMKAVGSDGHQHPIGLMLQCLPLDWIIQFHPAGTATVAHFFCLDIGLWKRDGDSMRDGRRVEVNPSEPSRILKNLEESWRIFGESWVSESVPFDSSGEAPGFKGSENIQFYPILSNIIQYYPILFNIIQYYSILSKNIQEYFRILGEKYPILFNIIQYSPICSNII